MTEAKMLTEPEWLLAIQTRYRTNSQEAGAHDRRMLLHYLHETISDRDRIIAQAKLVAEQQGMVIAKLWAQLPYCTINQTMEHGVSIPRMGINVPPESRPDKFPIGARVRKIKGYKWEGIALGTFDYLPYKNVAGEIIHRGKFVNVMNDDGAVMHYGEDQLEIVAPPTSGSEVT